MKRQVFDSLDHDELGWACIAPVMQPIRGKDLTAKSQVYSQLTTGQQALFMFYAYYNHAGNSLVEFYWWSAYFFAQPKIWSEIKTRLRYFEDDAILRLLEKMEGVLLAGKFPKSLEEFTMSYDDLDKDSELLESISPLNDMFHEIAPSTLKRVGTYIRNNPDKFVQIED